MEKREMFTAWDIENLQQLWTLYPHTPDNSFLGFAMELPNVSVPHSQRKNQAVIYGKKGKYFKKQFGQFLTVIGEEIELHATVNVSEIILT
jgi:alpha-1,3(6)-mannosylglycoprotein beta-1,6-N-acetyl-glucosaminyltransferase